MIGKKYSFSKNERIKSNKEISRIFNCGIFLFSEHISLCYTGSSDINPTYNKIAVSIPKKYFKSAVKRNKLKRQIKEVYRLNKNITNTVSELSSEYYNMVFVFKSKKLIPFQAVKEQVTSLLKKMAGQISK